MGTKTVISSFNVGEVLSTDIYIDSYFGFGAECEVKTLCVFSDLTHHNLLVDVTAPAAQKLLDAMTRTGDERSYFLLDLFGIISDIY